MPVRLTLLDGVRCDGATVVGERSQALLAALAARAGRTVRGERLVELIWGDEEPANATKGLQVVVSRTRTACGPETVLRDGDGYRLGLSADEVDSARLAALVAAAARAIGDDPLAAAERAREALTLADGLAAVAEDEPGPLADLRREAAADAGRARLLLARASSRTGAHEDALPVLEAAHAAAPDDEPLLADLLRSELEVRGPGAALDRYERYRRDLRERLGANPGEPLQRVHRDLLARDRPVRSGVRFDATVLLGRDRDVERLRSLLATSRVVSILGPGGLGKTRIAHVLARQASQPVVHVVELVGVTTPEDLVGEVGSQLGVRDSVSSRRTLTPEQRADVRARIAEQLARAPTLLILDNCEHLVAAVAELVAFLVATTADLRVVTTTRARLAIGAERVYPLGELAADDAVDLFRQRAVAARPDVRLDEAVVRRIVERLDGLPLAIELAAAKVRAMAVDEIDRRLEDRFALLRGGDRSAPDRHQTLLAVIDWSWNLLGDDERRALRWLALFHDGFTLETADAVLGDGAFEAIQGLVDQSLLSVHEAAGPVRYRMLETVREFGRMRLDAAGEREAAAAAQRAWAIDYATRHGRLLFGRQQFAAIDALDAEESNLADELRSALADGDPAAVARLMATLGGFWAIRGEHERPVVLIQAVAQALDGWEPPAELREIALAAATVTLGNAMVTSDEHAGPVRELLARLGPEATDDPRLAGAARVMLAYDPEDGGRFPLRLDGLEHDPDRHTALAALQWSIHIRENAGEPDRACEAGERALGLLLPDDGPWAGAILRTQLAQLWMQLGDQTTAMRHARAALPVLERLGARDDRAQLRALLALGAILDGRLDDAERELSVRISGIETIFGGAMVVDVGWAELALARGDHGDGLRRYQRVMAELRELRMPGIEPTGLEPWVLFGEATALTAFARFATTADEQAAGRELFDHALARCRAVVDPGDTFLDYPASGTLLFGLGSWGLHRGGLSPEDAVLLLVLADRFAYNRTIPTLAWEPAAARAEAVAPGALATAQAALGERRAVAVLDEARELAVRLVAVRRA
ncbi:ATP-binding protein [Patulibacter defluvii]|uniref:ATP-binding protein n=1 Tax=Patulibacter defluvii TaxID=3095358 RepID=UPI002A75F6FF|nr:BTAD domain-containing putative transcriptional regulator [Patulibacter sp. DM4]